MLICGNSQPKADKLSCLSASGGVERSPNKIKIDVAGFFGRKLIVHIKFDLRE